MREERVKRNLRGNLFTQRLVCIWNELPEEVVEPGTITKFKKNNLDKYMDKLVSRDMGRTQAGGTSVVGACWLRWATWAERPVSMLYDSMTLTSVGTICASGGAMIMLITPIFLLLAWHCVSCTAL